mmetsp:Transcript_26215/g.23198  ORF Transcript_26215/g.23198 Transcript_26215/m.23198 type:complete len:214 (+) Transcript_26215:927-1568(+)
MEILKEFSQISSSLFTTNIVLIGGQEYSFLPGQTSTGKFYYGRALLDELEELNAITSDTVSWSNIITTYLIASPVSPTAPNFSTVVITVNSIPSITSTDETDSAVINQEFEVAIYNKAFSQSIVANKKTSLDFIWACSHPNDFIAITFSLIDSGGIPKPEWIILDSSAQTMMMNKPPISVTDELYQFALKIDYDSKTTTKEFSITVEACLVDN